MRRTNPVGGRGAIDFLVPRARRARRTNPVGGLGAIRYLVLPRRARRAQVAPRRDGALRVALASPGTVFARFAVGTAVDAVRVAAGGPAVTFITVAVTIAVTFAVTIAVAAQITTGIAAVST